MRAGRIQTSGAQSRVAYLLEDLDALFAFCQSIDDPLSYCSSCCSPPRFPSCRLSRPAGQLRSLVGMLLPALRCRSSAADQGPERMPMPLAFQIGYDQRARRAVSFVDQMVQKHGFMRDQLISGIQARALQRHRRHVSSIPPRRPGPRCGTEYRGSLRRADPDCSRRAVLAQPIASRSRPCFSRTYGVPADVIMGILGVETHVRQEHRQFPGNSMHSPRSPLIIPTRPATARRSLP